MLIVRSRLDGTGISGLRRLQNTKSASSGSKRLQACITPVVVSSLGVADSGGCKRSMASNPTKCILVVYGKTTEMLIGTLVVYRKTTGVLTSIFVAISNGIFVTP